MGCKTAKSSFTRTQQRAIVAMKYDIASGLLALNRLRRGLTNVDVPKSTVEHLDNAERLLVDAMYQISEAYYSELRS